MRDYGDLDDLVAMEEVRRSQILDSLTTGQWSLGKKEGSLMISKFLS